MSVSSNRQTGGDTFFCVLASVNHRQQYVDRKFNIEKQLISVLENHYNEAAERAMI